MISPVVESRGKVREGKGFSEEELKAVELDPGKARSLGIPYDPRRKTSHDENVEALKEYLESAEAAGLRFRKPRQTGKPHVGRAFRGRTSAGKKMRNLSRRK
jgi:large subunit ribosomal protein L13e